MVNRKYNCTRCGKGEEQGVTRDELLVKKILFVGMGEGSRTYKSRVTEWLCPACVVADADWQRPAFVPVIPPFETVIA